MSNTILSNSYLSNNPDIPVRTTTLSTGTNANKHIQHMAIDSPFITYQDDVSASVVYYGFAQAGTATSAASWKIQKKTVSGTLTTYTFANGSPDFIAIWDNRASYSYS
jgi:hypothetical protein